jgi:hypothetical protein
MDEQLMHLEESAADCHLLSQLNNHASSTHWWWSDVQIPADIWTVVASDNKEQDGSKSKGEKSAQQSHGFFMIV